MSSGTQNRKHERAKMKNETSIVKALVLQAAIMIVVNDNYFRPDEVKAAKETIIKLGIELTQELGISTP